MHATARNLCLHYVADAPDPRRRMALSREQLTAAVERERAAGRAPASLADYLPGRTAPGPERFTLSFDDAHRSVLTHAAPLLRALGVPATLFVPTGYVGTSREFLSWDDLRALRDLGWSLGSHTASHPRMGWPLYDESPAAHRARLYDECARSREVLERALGVEVTLFAYPYGEAPAVAREAATRAGYERAFTVSDAIEWDDDAMGIPRLDGIEALGHRVARTDQPTGISVVVPACDRVDILAEVVRRLGAQSYPRERFEVLVVDDGSSQDITLALADVPPNVRSIPGGVQGEFRAGQARQRGADAASFETVAFLDADVAVGKDFLWHLDWVFRREPDAVVLGYLSGYNLHDMGHVHTLADVHGVADLERTLPVIPDRSREPTLRACLDNLDWLAEPWRLAYTGNLALPRALLARVGGFATEFVGWGLEDLDLGYRLHRAGAPWVFSRFAVGYHVVDPTEPSPRNPFRRTRPTREDFAPYLANLETLRARHADAPAIEQFRAQTLADVDETCGRPETVGVEMGGADTLPTIAHFALDRTQPGGSTTHEVLDRLAYAHKVGAKTVYLLGGEPAEHPGFLTIVREARKLGLRRVVTETNAAPFAQEGFAASARDAGLDHAVLKIHALDAAGFDHAVGTPGCFARFERGRAALKAAGVFCTAQVIVTAHTLASLAQTLEQLSREGLRVDELVAVGDEALAERARAVLAATVPPGVDSPPVRTAPTRDQES